MREISQKQVAQEAKERAEREKNSGLTLKELAELEAKRAEIARLERETAMNAERTASASRLLRSSRHPSMTGPRLRARNQRDGCPACRED